MKILHFFSFFLVLHGSTAGVVRKPPAFSTPMFSDSYLPAAMQVIFHTVEQLKALKMEESAQNNSVAIASTTSTTTTQKQEEPSTAVPLSMAVVELTTAATIDEKPDNSGTNNPPVQVYQASEETTAIAADDHQELIEVNEETPEANYATPEIDHESPESIHVTQETNHEVPEEQQDEVTTSRGNDEITSPLTNVESTTSVSAEKEKESEKKCTGTQEVPTVDGIVEGIYEIVKPTASIFDVPDDTQAKNTAGISEEKLESIEDEVDETRFTLLGEKVAQVPRPSLISYLRRAKVPVSASLEQLASLYDALSKDARKQGFGKFAGYSDTVLKILVTSAEGGVAPQMKTLLEKVLEHDELTREDAKVKTRKAIRDLDDPSSILNKDLRNLLPLRYAP